MRGGAKRAPCRKACVTPLRTIILIYAGWLVVCGVAAWYLARWSARRRLHGVLFAVLVLLAVINLAQIVYVLGFGESLMIRPRNALEKFLQHTDRLWYILYALWPFATAIGLAQTSLKISSHHATLARWTSFGCSVAIAALTPLFLIFTTCGLAGVCL
jgi:hypothetical protein